MARWVLPVPTPPTSTTLAASATKAPPQLGLDARPFVQRGAVHSRVVRQLGRLHDAAPRPLLGRVAGVDRRTVRGVSAALGGGQHCEGVAAGPSRFVFLNQPGAAHLRHQAPGGVGVAVKMLCG